MVEAVPEDYFVKFEVELVLPLYGLVDLLGRNGSSREANSAILQLTLELNEDSSGLAGHVDSTLYLSLLTKTRNG